MPRKKRSTNSSNSSRDRGKPTTGQVIGKSLVMLGRRLAGAPAPQAARADRRQIVPKPTATIRRLEFTCTECKTKYAGDAVRLQDGRATCTDCGTQAMYVDFGAEALTVI